MITIPALALSLVSLLFWDLLNHRETQRALQEKIALDYRLAGALSEARYLLRDGEMLPGDLVVQSVFFPDLTIKIDPVASLIVILKKNRSYLEADFSGSGESVTIRRIVSQSNIPYAR
ncbi:MAG TPA: hypothetical protein VLH40_05255 [Atribacteraceae bacterium]|nr:hypothetical protein [Atribacteraceae bacterium]